MIFRPAITAKKGFNPSTLPAGIFESFFLGKQMVPDSF
jgi:hypothetical protein